MILEQELKLMIPIKKETQLKKKGFSTYGDLLRFTPRKYEDRSNYIPFSQLAQHIDEKVLLVGAIKQIKADYSKKYVRLFLCDQNSRDYQGVGVFFFHQMYIQNKYAVGDCICVFGKLTENNGYFSLVPEYVSSNFQEATKPMPVYSKVPGMATEYLRACIKEALINVWNKAQANPTELEDFPSLFKTELHLDDTLTYLRKTHFPDNMKDVSDALYRKKVELITPVAVGLVKKENETKTQTDKVINNHSLVKKLRQSLPFDLTPDQNEAVNRMLITMASGSRLDMLLQADVGAGKTICAALAIAAVIGSGYQAVVMAPTSVLAEQHYKEFSGYFPDNTVLLTSKLKSRERKAILKKISSGEASVIVGTHSAIAKDVLYNNLALTVVDEEHRFGVVQRDLLRGKAKEGAHTLSMSATPIPRSLALSVHGAGTEVFDIHTMPKGRKPVKTIVYQNEINTYKSLYNQIKAGHQGYIVCPLIEASDKAENVESIEDTYKKVCRFFENTSVRVSCIHGNMKQVAIDEEINKFARGDVDILLSTTIVEVGVNVPNATVMVIKNAERFGLAQLHQLRGRVGRSSDQGYCVLLSDQITSPRLAIMANTTDGFEVAKADLELRGTGNLIGTNQSGFDKAVEVIAGNIQLYNKIKNLVSTQISDYNIMAKKPTA